MTQTRVERLLIAAMVIIACVLPFILDKFWTERITMWIPLALGALGLNLLTGYNGQISVGHSAFFGVGAYTCGLAVTHWRVPFLVGIVLAAVLCFVVGVIVGVPALRIKGMYLALVTLAVATLFPQLLEQFHDLTGGSTGLMITSPQEYRGTIEELRIEFEAPSGLGLQPDQWRYLFFLAVAMVCFVCVRNIVHSRIGRAMVAIRDNETAAEVAGVHTAVVKVVTFGISSALAGVGGAILALGNGQVFSTSFTVALSLYLLVAMVVGGPATIMGPAVGAVVYGLFEDVLKPELPESARAVSPLILGVLLVVTMFFAPGGILGWLKGQLSKRRSRAITGAGV